MAQGDRPERVHGLEVDYPDDTFEELPTGESKESPAVGRDATGWNREADRSGAQLRGAAARVAGLREMA